MIAAVPAMLGFVPTQSIVIAMLSTDRASGARRTIRALIRTDIGSVTDPIGARHLTTSINSVRRREDMTSIMVIVVDNRPTALTTAHALLRNLAQADTDTVAAWLVPTITTGARYQDLLTGREGTIDDPRTSTVALAHVLEGNQIRNSRHELVDLLAPNPDLAARVRPHIGPAALRYRHNLSTATDNGNTVRHETARTLVARIRTAEHTPVTAHDLATIVVALRDRTIRDVMFALADTEDHLAAQAVWQTVATVTSGSDRAEASTLFAYSAYSNANTVVAGIAVTEALRADPHHTMAVLLDVALRDGVRPDQVRRIAEAGREVAADLGITINPAD
nr:DUF4192 domain-containing protein [Nocardia sp. GTS18]